MTLPRGMKLLECQKCQKSYAAWDIKRPHYCKKCRMGGLYAAVLEMGKP